jgi:hypothetical protein
MLFEKNYGNLKTYPESNYVPLKDDAGQLEQTMDKFREVNDKILCAFGVDVYPRIIKAIHGFFKKKPSQKSKKKRSNLDQTKLMMKRSRLELTKKKMKQKNEKETKNLMWDYFLRDVIRCLFGLNRSTIVSVQDPIKLMRPLILETTYMIHIQESTGNISKMYLPLFSIRTIKMKLT